MCDMLQRLSSVGVSDEWHLVFAKAFQDIAFGLVSWFHETIVRFGSAFSSARFEAIRPIGDAMGGDGIE